jgi:hypothetical protein
VIAPRPAASRPGGAGKRFVVGDGRAAEPAAAADAAAPLGGVALLSLQSAAIAGRADEHSETAAALGDLAALQLAVLRGKPMSLPELRGLAVRAERLADADAGGNAVAGALALRLRVEIARLEMPRTAGA